MTALKIAAFCGNDNVRPRLEMRGNRYKANGLDARDESFRELVLKYGDKNVYDKILEFC